MSEQDEAPETNEESVEFVFEATGELTVTDADGNVKED